MNKMLVLLAAGCLAVCNCFAGKITTFGVLNTDFPAHCVDFTVNLNSNPELCSVSYRAQEDVTQNYPVNIETSDYTTEDDHERLIKDQFLREENGCFFISIQTESMENFVKNLTINYESEERDYVWKKTPTLEVETFRESDRSKVVLRHWSGVQIPPVVIETFRESDHPKTVLQNGSDVQKNNVIKVDQVNLGVSKIVLLCERTSVTVHKVNSTVPSGTYARVDTGTNGKFSVGENIGQGDCRAEHQGSGFYKIVGASLLHYS